MNIAVVGDVHGHLALLFAILGRWQRESGRTIDLVLQVGDLGVFLPSSTLDPATRRHAERNPEELGFAEFAGPHPPPTLLDPRPPLVFVPGNHEDFEFLEARASAVDDAEPIYPVSEDGSIHAIRSGRVWTCVEPHAAPVLPRSRRFGETRWSPGGGGSEPASPVLSNSPSPVRPAFAETTADHAGPAAAGDSVRIAGVAGAANLAHKKSRHARAHLDEDDALGLAGAGRGAIDLLISHDGPTGTWTSFRGGAAGSPALRLLIEETQPAYAFFGHYGRGGDWTIGATTVVGLGDVAYEPFGEWAVGRDGIAVIAWSAGAGTLERIAPPWLREATRFTWKHWGTAL